MTGQPDHRSLFDLASSQGGYFTAAQASSCGLSRSLVAHHARSGRFIRVRRGLYRLREYPASPREMVLAAWLAAGRDVAVVSHESALDILNLSDVVPDAVHLTVPRSRRYVPSSPGVKIHTTLQRLDPAEIVIREGVKVTSALRSIVDAADTGTAPDQIIAAVLQAVERGMATESQLVAAAHERGGRVERLVRRALEERRGA